MTSCSVQSSLPPSCCLSPSPVPPQVGQDELDKERFHFRASSKRLCWVAGFISSVGTFSCPARSSCNRSASVLVVIPGSSCRQRNVSVPVEFGTATKSGHKNCHSRWRKSSSNRLSLRCSTTIASLGGATHSGHGTSVMGASCFDQPLRVFYCKHLFFSVHSLCCLAWKVLALRVGSSSRSRLPGSAAASKQLCVNTRPPGSECTVWFTQHPSVLLAGIEKKQQKTEERVVGVNEGGRSRLYPGGPTGRCGCGGRAAGG